MRATSILAAIALVGSPLFAANRFDLSYLGKMVRVLGSANLARRQVDCGRRFPPQL